MWSQSRRIYAAEFKCGVVKVGITAQPGDRRGMSLRFRGAQINRIVYGDLHELGTWCEWELLKRMRRIGTAIEGREWFVGVRWSVAVQLVKQITRQALARIAQYEANRAAFLARQSALGITTDVDLAVSSVRLSGHAGSLFRASANDVTTGGNAL